MWITDTALIRYKQFYFVVFNGIFTLFVFTLWVWFLTSFEFRNCMVWTNFLIPSYPQFANSPALFKLSIS